MTPTVRLLSLLTVVPVFTGLATLAAPACSSSDSSDSEPSGSAGSTSSGGSASGGNTSSGGSAGSSGGEGGQTGGDLKAQVLTHLGEHVILGTYQEFGTAMGELQTATAAQQQSLASLEDVQDRWRDAIWIWQRAELMQIGPAGLMDMVDGGEDLRDDIYSWPFSVACRVDQELVNQAWDDPAFAQENINVRGLDAVEYLTFNTSSENDCSSALTINTSGAWTGIQDSLPQLRADYAHAAVGLVIASNNDLIQRWQPTGGNFLGQLTSPGSGSIYASQQKALSAVANALFYVETEVKDMKLGKVAGIINCMNATCPEAAESLWAGASRDHVIANLEGLQLLFDGNLAGEDAKPGFDDLLVDVGQDALAKDMSDAIVASLDAVKAIEENDLREAVDEDPESVETAYTALQAFTTLLKTQFFSVLDLEVNNPAGSDND